MPSITRLVAVLDLALVVLTVGSGWLPAATGAAPFATGARAWLACAALLLAAGALLRPSGGLVAIAAIGQAALAGSLVQTGGPSVPIGFGLAIANLTALGCARAAAERAARRPRPSWRPRVSASP